MKEFSFDDDKWRMHVLWDDAEMAEFPKAPPYASIHGVSHEAHSLAHGIGISQLRLLLAPLGQNKQRTMVVDLKSDTVLLKIDAPSYSYKYEIEPKSGLSNYLPGSDLRTSSGGVRSMNFLRTYNATENTIRFLYRLKRGKWLEILGIEDLPANKELLTNAVFDFEVLFAFGPYSSQPGHEPSGVLHAARLIPLVTFRTNREEIQAVRCDVVFDLALTAASPGMPKDSTPCLALASRDHEHFSSAILKAVGNVALPGLMLPSGFRSLALLNLDLAGLSFDYIEKPLQYEILTYGLYEGKPNFELGDKEFLTWDTVHFWPGIKNSKGKYEPGLPSAPGAFYALHCHWRWSYGIQNPSTMDRFLAAMSGLDKGLSDKERFGNPLKSDKGEELEIGGPLVDPNLEFQTINVAVLKNKASSEQIDPTSPVFKFAEWFGASHNKSSEEQPPTDISAGKDLVWIMSFEAFPKRLVDVGAEEREWFGGSMFLQGVYFPHNFTEPPGFVAQTQGRESFDRVPFLFRFPHKEHAPLPRAKPE